MLRLEALHEVEHLRADRHVEGAHRLVGDDHLRFEHQRPRQRDPLSLTAREFVRISLERVLGKPNLIEQLPDLLVLLLVRSDLLDDQRLAQQSLHPHARIERRVGVLEHHLEIAARRAQGSAAQPEHLASVQRHPARIRFLDPDDQLAQGCLPASRLADQAQRLARADRQRHARDGLYRVDLALEDRALGDGVLAHDIVDLEQGAVAARRLRGLRGGLDEDLGLFGRAVDGVPAGEEMVGVVPRQPRLLLAALLGRPRTTGREAAAGGRIREIRGQTSDADECLAAVLIEPRDRAEQRLGVWMSHGAEDVFGGGALDDPAGVHDADPVASPGHDAHVVRHEQCRHPEALLEVVEQREDLGLDGHVQGGGRLVGEQHLRLAGERDGDHHPLAQAPGEVMRILLAAAPWVWAARPAPAPRARGRGLLASTTLRWRLYRLGHLLADLLRRVERGLRVLEDHRDLVAAQLLKLGIAESDELAPAERHRAPDDLAAPREQAEDRQPEHRLAAPRLADQSEGLADVDREIDVPNGLHGRSRQLDVRGQVLDLEGTSIIGRHRYRRLSRTSRASRSPSPMRLKAITTATRQNPTGYTSHHCPLEI